MLLLLYMHRIRARRRSPRPGDMEISAALAAGCDPGALLLGDRPGMAAAIAYFCGGRCNATAVDVGALTMQLSPVERADILQGYRPLTSHQVVQTKSKLFPAR